MSLTPQLYGRRFSPRRLVCSALQFFRLASIEDRTQEFQDQRGGQQTGLAVYVHERIDFDQVEADHVTSLGHALQQARTSW